MNNPTILIVDDDPNIRFAFQKTFQSQKYETITAAGGEEAIKILEESDPSLIFMDIMMPDSDGLEILKKIKNSKPDIPVVMITGFGTMQTAIRAMQSGAYDYLTKPLDIEKVRLTAQRALELLKMRQQLTDLQRQLLEKKPKRGTELIGQNPQMQDVYKKIGVISTTPNTTNILLMGETGTGKELVAKAIHESGQDADEPFIAINCTVLPENLLESELFGHEKGAFTGAENLKPGKFEIAGKGTLFLDEIGDMPVSLQKKLLRVIQERTFERLGSNKPISVGARIIASTHHDLAKAVKQDHFREDLYYRLKVIEILLPPLRERMDDIPVLADYFLEKYNKRFGKNISQISLEVMDALSQFNFPGNIRELENLIERAVALERGNSLTPHAFPAELFNTQNLQKIDIPIIDQKFNIAKKAVVEAFEKKFLIRRLQETSGNVTEAARISGIERQSFQRLMKKYNLSSRNFLHH
jgi:two-component system NtrC family response regulator